MTRTFFILANYRDRYRALREMTIIKSTIDEDGRTKLVSKLFTGCFHVRVTSLGFLGAFSSMSVVSTSRVTLSDHCYVYLGLSVDLSGLTQVRIL